MVGAPQLHRALGEVMGNQEFVVAAGDDVDDRIPHGNDVERGVGHGGGREVLEVTEKARPPNRTFN